MIGVDDLLRALRDCPATRHPVELDAAIAAPDEDRCRHQLAERLDRTEDHWAEMIRLQLDWDALHDVERDRQRGSLVRQAEILREHPFLRAAVAGSGSTRGPLRMRGGLVEGAELAAKAYADGAAEIARLTPLRDIELFPMSAADVPALLATKELDRIRSLRITCPELGDAGARQLLGGVAWSGLRELDFSDTGATDATLEVIATTDLLSQLKRLAVSNASLSARGFASLSEASSLNALSLEGRWIDADVLAALAEATFAARLEELCLIGPAASLSLGALVDAGLESLRELTLSDAPGDAPSAQQLLASATSLESLYLDGRQVGDGVAAALVDKEHLQKLCLRNAGIGPSGAEALARSHLLARLGWLDLSVNPLGDAGASALTTATFAASLTRVSLERCAVGPAGVAALASAMPNLISLGLAGNPIGDEGARLLAGCPQLVQLEELKLSGCGIGTDGATALLDSPHLARAAIITGTAPDAEVRRRLRERRAIREPFLAL